MSELFDIQVNAQKESLKENFRGSCKLPQAHEKCAMRMKGRNKQEKCHARKNVVDGRDHFIRPV